MKNKILLIGGLALVSIFLAFFYPNSKIEAIITDEVSSDLLDDAIIPQQVLKAQEEEKLVSTIYYKDQQLGIITDKTKIDEFLNGIYEERYMADFPDSKVGFGADIHVTEAYSLFEVENKDDEIIQYILENDLFSIMGYKVTFSNGSVAYVKNPNDFVQAREDFVLNFLEYDGVDPKETYRSLVLKQEPRTPADDESVDVAYSFEDSASVTKEFVPIEKILKSYEECMTWLSFGYDFEPVYETVSEYDTLQGFAWKLGISVANLISINPDIVKSEEQLLQAGMELNTAKLTPPIDVKIVKHRMAIERVEPEATLYIYDEEMREGTSSYDSQYKAGSRRALYEETYVNGDLTDHTEISALILEYPVQEVMRIGTRVEPKIGSGNFWWPVDNPSITCSWGCYWGHTALDIQNRYNNWGPVKASDRGVIAENSYSYVNGYYVTINHNNGYYTYYGHMSGPGFYPVGTTVAQGEQIGNIGMTGWASGPHVHFEVRSGGYGTSLYTCNFLGC